MNERPRASLTSWLSRSWRNLTFGPDKIGASQSDEAALIERLVRDMALPKTFCEFGFHIIQFNCARLVRNGWDGLLIDGDRSRARRARNVLARDKTLRAEVRNVFLNETNLLPTVVDYLKGRALGVLSVDVDGNDYWFTEKLLPLKPHIVVVEYNASLGLRPITVPYDPLFDRHAKHPTGWYHGASITAFHAMAAGHGYGLIGTSKEGLNLFFIRKDVLPQGVECQTSAAAYHENSLRNAWSGTNAESQWAAISHLPFVQVESLQ
jgi:hypothetical protein